MLLLGLNNDFNDHANTKANAQCRAGSRIQGLCVFGGRRDADADACNVARVSCNVAGVSFNVAQVFIVMLHMFPVMLHVFPVTLQETRATLHAFAVRVRVRRIHKANTSRGRYESFVKIEAGGLY